jgi:hypothetical protein
VISLEIYLRIPKKCVIKRSNSSVYNPNKLSGYLTTGGASNPLDEGKEVTWDFHDFPGAFPVQVKQTIKNKKNCSRMGQFRRRKYASSDEFQTS